MYNRKWKYNECMCNRSPKTYSSYGNIQIRISTFSKLFEFKFSILGRTLTAFLFTGPWLDRLSTGRPESKVCYVRRANLE